MGPGYALDKRTGSNPVGCGGEPLGFLIRRCGDTRGVLPACWSGYPLAMGANLIFSYTLMAS